MLSLKNLTNILLPQKSGIYEVNLRSRDLGKTNTQYVDSPNPLNQSNDLNSNKDGVTLCTLGVGTTFGASVTPGKSHSVSVVTSDQCTLLRVRRADFQEIFNEQSHLINNVESSPFCSFTSLNRMVNSTGNSISGRRLSAMQRRQAKAKSKLCATGQAPPDEEEDDSETETNINIENMDSNELSSQLMRIGWVLRTLMLDQCPKLIQNRRVYPHQMISQHQTQRLAQAQQTQQQQPQATQKASQKPIRQLISRGSSSQLLSNSSTKSTGRKVANYVASSFMRSSKQQQSQPQPQPIQSSNSLDADQSIQPTSVLNRNASQSVRRHNPNDQISGEPIQLQRSMLGREMVDWLLEMGQSNTVASRFISSRLQAVSMWQVLLEQGIVFSLNPNGSQSDSSRWPRAQSSGSYQEVGQQFCQFRDDSQAYYKFWFEREGTRQAEVENQEKETWNFDSLLPRPSEQEFSVAMESLWWSLRVLSKLAADACFRLILSKQPHERNSEEVDIVFEELQQLKALSHLTNGVKKQLAACVRGEFHAKQNTVIFNQGDTGHSWYIILRGSVNVVIVGKGVVCTLYDGDDFGKLALVNDAPRAATIVTSEASCYFLRVDKHDFNTILRDVEANTVRLNEHGKLIELSRERI